MPQPSQPVHPAVVVTFAALLFAIGVLGVVIHGAVTQPAAPAPIAPVARPAPPKIAKADVDEAMSNLQRNIAKAVQADEVDPDGATEVTGAALPILLQMADANRTVTYAHLKKNADRHIGKAWAFAGKIIEIGEHEEGGRMVTIARVSLDGWGEKVMMVAAPFATDFVEGNRVDVAGFLLGSHTYQSQAGWTITIPLIRARAVLARGGFDKARGRRAKRERPSVTEDGVIRYLDE